jgi:nicotinate-nucleotide adenylyltransferase
VVDPIDLDTERPSYTSELLTRIRGDHPGDNLWFIIGGDSLAEFHTWHAPERILELARIAVAARPGWDLQEALSISPVRDLRQSVDVFSSVPIDLSATTIRHRLRDGRPVDWLVPSGVLDHIEEEGLYEEPRAETR